MLLFLQKAFLFLNPHFFITPHIALIIAFFHGNPLNLKWPKAGYYGICVSAHLSLHRTCHIVKAWESVKNVSFAAWLAGHFKMPCSMGFPAKRNLKKCFWVLERQTRKCWARGRWSGVCGGLCWLAGHLGQAPPAFFSLANGLETAVLRKHLRNLEMSYGLRPHWRAPLLQWMLSGHLDSS